MQILFFDPVHITEDAAVLFGAVANGVMVPCVVTVDWLAILEPTASQDPMAAATKHRQRIEAAFTRELERRVRVGLELPENLTWTSSDFSKPD